MAGSSKKPRGSSEISRSSVFTSAALIDGCPRRCMRGDGYRRGADDPDRYINVPGLGILAASSIITRSFSVCGEATRGSKGAGCTSPAADEFDGTHREALPRVSLGNCIAASDFASASSCAVSFRSNTCAAASNGISARVPSTTRCKEVRRNFGVVRIVNDEQASAVPSGTTNRRGRLGCGPAASSLPPVATAAAESAWLCSFSRLESRFSRAVDGFAVGTPLATATPRGVIRMFGERLCESMNKRCCCKGNASAYWRRISPTTLYA